MIPKKNKKQRDKKESKSVCGVWVCYENIAKEYDSCDMDCFISVCDRFAEWIFAFLSFDIAVAGFKTKKELKEFGPPKKITLKNYLV